MGTWVSVAIIELLQHLNKTSKSRLTSQYYLVSVMNEEIHVTTHLLKGKTRPVFSTDFNFR